ncbi:MAG: RagB/SusD family nutrient uptake outer membrane protein [Bacteroidaceae bacterium]|nr:RagB/SusD family nutrient uptake outer membrane protein [Bacteroidaceae bacterium]
MCDEWCREFYFEGRRRMDLVRFGNFGGSTSYNWMWKGSSYIGRNFESYRNVFAIPTTELTTNPNLVQNEGYR